MHCLLKVGHSTFLGHCSVTYWDQISSVIVHLIFSTFSQKPQGQFEPIYLVTNISSGHQISKMCGHHPKGALEVGQNVLKLGSISKLFYFGGFLKQILCVVVMP